MEHHPNLPSRFFLFFFVFFPVGMPVTTTGDHEAIRRRLASMARTQRALRASFLAKPSAGCHSSATYGAAVPGTESEYGSGCANVGVSSL
jgi:hypothetical protein